MENIDDSVLIGTDTARGKLTVYNNSINSTGILGHGAGGVYGETFHHLASGVRGVNRQNSAAGSLGGPYCGVSGTNSGNPDISAGCFSGLVEVYNGTIEVGGHLEDFAGTILTVRDDDNEGYAGISFGQDSDNRGWMAYDNEDDYIYWGTKENGSFSPSTISFKNGNVGIGSMPPDTVSLYVYDIYNLSLRDEWGFGVRSYIINTGPDGRACGGSFYASGSYAAYGVRGEARNAAYAVGGDFYSDYIALRASAEGGGTIAGHCNGNVNIYGLLSKSGGSFKIDHPLDPENKYLQHSFVESPDMMNVYNGNVITDSNGEAEVALPEYFETLNKDFRYQLTVIGTFAQAIIAEKIQDGRFMIKTDRPDIEVSWQVTGIRQDPWADAHRIEVEPDKPEPERGYYIAPELYGFGEERGIDYKLHGSREFRK